MFSIGANPLRLNRAVALHSNKTDRTTSNPIRVKQSDNQSTLSWVELQEMKRIWALQNIEWQSVGKEPRGRWMDSCTHDPPSIIKACFYWWSKTRSFLWNAFTAWRHIYEFYCPMREWAKWVSKPVNGTSKRSKQSERCKWTNVESDRVARLNSDCLWQEMPPKSIIVVLWHRRFCDFVHLTTVIFLTIWFLVLE